MSGSIFVYSNARVKAKEKSLLTSTQLNRLIDCQSLSEAFKMLVEFGWGSGQPFEHMDFDKLFEHEEERATEVLRELDVKDSGIDVFLKKNDFHNLKALYKARELDLLSSKEKLESVVLAPYGNIAVSVLVEALATKEYFGLSDYMKKVLVELDLLKVSDKLTPHTIDAEIDKAMYAEIIQTLKLAKRHELMTYIVKSIDIANISAFIRSKRLNLSYKFFENGFISGGELKIDFFEPQFEQPLEFFKEKSKYNRFSSIVASAVDEKNLTKFEVESDNMLLNLFKKERNNMFSSSPIVGFYLGKLTELKAVKLVVATIKNGVDKEVMKQRMRELYA